jgi:hypothetical protein
LNPLASAVLLGAAYPEAHVVRGFIEGAAEVFDQG